MGLVKPVVPSLQRHHPLAQGLVIGYPFVEGTGDILHNLSGRGINGTMHYGAGGGAWAGGQFGSSWSQINAGGTQYIDTGLGVDQIFNNGSATVAGTISIWVYHTTPFNSGSSYAVFDHDDSGGKGLGIVHFTDNNLYVGFAGQTGGDDRVVVAASATNWPQNAWVHYAVTWVVGGLTSFYVNGVLVGTHACSSADVTNTRTLRLGYYYFAGTSFAGNFDAFTGWNRALSATEVAQLYFDPFVMYRPGLRMWMLPPPPPALAPRGWFDAELIGSKAWFG